MNEHLTKVSVLLSPELNEKFETLSKNIIKLTERLHTYDFDNVAKNKNQLVVKAAEIGVDSIIQQFQEMTDYDIMDENAVNQVINEFEEELQRELKQIDKDFLPDVRIYEEEIVKILKSKESHFATPAEIYKKIAKNLDLTAIQLGAVYKKTKRTIHENRTQFAVLNLRNRGILLPASEGHGIWALSENTKETL